MKKVYFIITLTILLLAVQNVKPASSADEPFYATPKVRPNVLILLDRSGSMEDQPNCAGYCNGDGSYCAQSATDTDGDTIMNLWDSTPGCADENKISIAVRVLADLLDANDSRTIDNTNDPNNLEVRLGYSRFINGVFNITNVVGSPYANIFTAFNSSDTGGNTPLGNSLDAALYYFQNDTSITDDGCEECRKNYVILITDGADTATCDSQTARNRSVVYAADALYKANIPVFVVGFGNLPYDLKYTLNWAAYYGYGQNDPYTSVPEGNNTDTGSFTPGALLCDSGAADPGTEIKLGYAFLSDNSSDLASDLQRIIGIINAGSFSRSAPVLTSTGIGGANRIYAGFFDLGTNVNWQGHLLAWDIDPATGNLIDSPIDDPCTSSLSTPNTGALRELYDAGRTITYYTDANCIGVAPNARKVYTAVGSPALSQIWFNISDGSTAYDSTFFMSNSSAQQIDLCTALNITGFNCNANYADPDTSAVNNNPNELINFIRFSSTTFNGSGGARNNNWHLGDIWHSTPTIVGPPFGTINSSAYKAFKTNNANRTQILIVGANDGMLHALDDTKKGSEMWSFIPNNLLGKLKNLNTGHSFFVDASPTAADVCLQANCGTANEAATDWETVVISGERDGGRAYFALKLVGTTDTTPEFKWEFTNANLGNTWSKPTIGKVRYFTGANTVDKWVTFFGGGVSSTADVGNYVYAVDIANGSLLGSGPNATKKQVDSSNTSNNVPSALRPVDLSGDNYIDAVYFGDAFIDNTTNPPTTTGRMHRWDVSNLANNNNGSLTGFFDPGATHYYSNNGIRTTENAHVSRPIYYRPSIALDKSFRPIVVFGTGNIDELAAAPPDTTTIDYVYAIRQEAGYAGNEADQGGVTELWKIPLNCSNVNPNFACGERLAGATMLYGGYVLFTTYRPPTTNTCTENGNVVSCDRGSGWLYIADFETGAILADYPQELGEGLPAMTCSGDKCYTITSNNQDIQVKDMPSKYPPTAETIYWRER